jgi:endonuclease/exonuclease/phosphatase family metal-dependent hydrolase
VVPLLIGDSIMELNVHVLTLNIRYGTAADGGDSWNFRRRDVAECIKANAATLVCLQEALLFQVSTHEYSAEQRALLRDAPCARSTMNCWNH